MSRQSVEQRDKKYIHLAFTVFISGTVAYVLKSLAINIPGNAWGSIQWIVASLLIIGSVLALIYYILDYFPNFEDKISWFKTALLISSGMTFLSFARYHMFLNINSMETATYTEMIDWSYNSFLTFFGFCGFILLWQSLYYRKVKENIHYQVAFALIGIILIIIGVIFKIFVSPYGRGGI